jgi:hypothetical protein
MYSKIEGDVCLKKLYLAVIIGLLCSVGLAACNSDEDNGESLEEIQAEGTEDGAEEAEETEEESKEEETESETDLITESEFDDQLDLQIGDTGQVQTNLDAFEVTINSVRKETELDEELAQLDFFVIADITLTNISDIAIDADAAKGTLELANSLDGSGFSDISGQGYEGIESIDGELNPDESINGQMVFQINDSDEFYIRITGGLLAADGVLNDVRWTFTDNDLE